MDPLTLLLGGGAALLLMLTGGKKKAAPPPAPPLPPPATPQSPALFPACHDPLLPAALATELDDLLVHETSPDRLEDAAVAYVADGYSAAADCLTARAKELDAIEQSWLPAPDALTSPDSPHYQCGDSHMTEAELAQLDEERLTGYSKTQLLELASHYELQGYPAAAACLRTQADATPPTPGEQEVEQSAQQVAAGMADFFQSWF